MIIAKMSELLDDNLLPEATYDLRVHKAEHVEKPKSSTAKPYVHVWLVVAGPDDWYRGRMIFANYPLEGNGKYRLRELLEVTGHLEDFELQDARQLEGLELRAIVMIEKGTNGYKDKNVIRKHLPLLVSP